MMLQLTKTLIGMEELLWPRQSPEASWSHPTSVPDPQCSQMLCSWSISIKFPTDMLQDLYKTFRKKSALSRLKKKWGMVFSTFASHLQGCGLIPGSAPCVLAVFGIFSLCFGVSFQSPKTYVVCWFTSLKSPYCVNICLIVPCDGLPQHLGCPLPLTWVPWDKLQVPCDPVYRKWKKASSLTKLDATWLDLAMYCLY